MFRWTDEMIAFMKDAAAAGSYQKELSAWICEKLPQAGHVCDAGCGLGFLSLQLAAQYPKVTAADISDQALAVLRERAEAQNLSNLHILQIDLLHDTPPMVFDAMVFCLFGHMDEVLRIAKRCCRGRVVVIKKAFSHHRFSFSSVPLKDEQTDQAAQYLERLGIPFELETRTFEMGQPLRSLDAAVRFFEVYSKDAPGTLSKDLVAQRLVHTDDARFPFYLPQSKALGRFTIQTKDIPEEFL